MQGTRGRAENIFQGVVIVGDKGAATVSVFVLMESICIGQGATGVPAGNTFEVQAVIEE